MYEPRAASAKGIEPCPACGSDQVRWRKRRPTDFLLTWMRSLVEWFWAGIRGQGRAQHRNTTLAEYGYIDTSEYDAPEVQAELQEATSGHKTPQRFWHCKACGREGHVF